MTPTIYSSPLLARVQKLLIERPRSVLIKDLAKEVGVTPTWLSGFTNGRMPAPNAIVIEQLYVKLTGEQLIND